MGAFLRTKTKQFWCCVPDEPAASRLVRGGDVNPAHAAFLEFHTGLLHRQKVLNKFSEERFVSD
jgi:hypothetical protein